MFTHESVDRSTYELTRRRSPPGSAAIRARVSHTTSRAQSTARPPPAAAARPPTFRLGLCAARLALAHRLPTVVGRLLTADPRPLAVGRLLLAAAATSYCPARRDRLRLAAYCCCRRPATYAWAVGRPLLTVGDSPLAIGRLLVAAYS